VKTPDTGSSEEGTTFVEDLFAEPFLSLHDRHSFGVHPGYLSTTPWDNEKVSPHCVHVKSGMGMRVDSRQQTVDRRRYGLPSAERSDRTVREPKATDP